MAGASASAGEPAYTPTMRSPGLRCSSFVRRLLGHARRCAQQIEPPAALRRRLRHQRHQVGAGHPLRQPPPQPPRGPQQTDAVRHAQISVQQRLAELAIGLRGHDELRVGRGDLMRPALFDPMCDYVEHVGIGHGIDAHAQNVDGRKSFCHEFHELNE